MDFSRSEALHSEASEVLVGGVSSGFRKNITPLQYFERADGPCYYDVDGNDFVEYTLAWGPLILGHAHPEVVDAIKSALQS